MKIIGIANRSGYVTSSYICEVGASEISQLLGELYGQGEHGDLAIGTEIDVKALRGLCHEMAETKKALPAISKTLRLLADVLDRECIAIVPPPVEALKE